MSSVKKKQLLWWSITIVIMGIIFWFSAQNKASSSSMSLGVRGMLAQFMDIFGLRWLAEMDGFHSFVRKCAHAIAYFSLGISSALATRHSGWKKAPWWALLICVLYAASDEVHQAFVPGRGPLVRDVVLDSVSAAVGIGLSMLVKKRRFWKNKTSE